MEQLTMLVQLAGGDPETARRLRAAGFRGAKEIARADAEDLHIHSGLSAAATRRLIRAAKETLTPDGRRGNSFPLNRLRGLPSVLTGGGKASGAKRRSKRKKAPAPASSPPELVVPTDQGVDQAETSSLLGDVPSEERIARSFWRFG